jgi:transketolase
MDSEKIKELKRMAVKIREDVVRTSRDCSEGVHVGGSLSMAEILSVLFFEVAKLDPKNPKWEKRDRVILSKGHGNVGFAAAMAHKGFFSLDELNRFDMLNAPLSMHVDKHRMPGVEVSSGSLGHGLPISVGIALGGRLDKADWKVYCILGDGEMMEGSVWEALMSAANFKLDNLTAIIDRNRFSLDGPTEKIMALEPLARKLIDFGWSVLEVNGHSVEELIKAFDTPPETGKPRVIIADTVKGKGVSFIENTTGSHFAHFKPEQAEQALNELEKAMAEIG